MPHLTEGMSCCGYDEIHDLSSYRGNFKEALEELVESGLIEEDLKFQMGALLFTAAGRGASYAKKFAADITKNDLGSVTQIPTFTNPNTGNPINSYVWVIAKTRTLAFLKKHKLIEPELKYDRWGYRI